jgi:hypothetical protein
VVESADGRLFCCVHLRAEGSASRCTCEHEETAMPRQQHLRGVGTKEQRQYQPIKDAAKREGRYGKRAAEVAARTVLKQHKKRGHRKGQ